MTPSIFLYMSSLRMCISGACISGARVSGVQGGQQLLGNALHLLAHAVPAYSRERYVH